MRLPRRDIIATALVGAAGVLYLLWATESALPGMSGTRATGMVILGLGFVASASAVVPGFEDLLHGNKAYLALTSLIGLVAFGAGVQMLVSTSETALGVLVAGMIVLWLIATAHHVALAEGRPAARQPGTGVHRHGPWAAGTS
jgi:hypothetical protein